MNIHNQIINADCFDILPKILSNSVDLILTDPPYGKLKCEWDCCINLNTLWGEFNRIIKGNGAMVVCSRQPFTTDLIVSNRKLFRYEIIWKKTMALGFLDAKRMPLRAHENILVFYKKQPVYNPQKTPGEPSVRTVNSTKTYSGYGSYENLSYKNKTGERYPIDVLEFSNWSGALFGDTRFAGKHPTQKPIELFSWFIKTYTNEGDLVLDPFSGSGTTAIACKRLNRQFFAIEKNNDYYEYSIDRLSKDVHQQDFNFSENSDSPDQFAERNKELQCSINFSEKGL